MRTDALDLFAQAVVTGGREFGRRLMQRPHVRAAAVAVGFDQHDFGAAHGGVNLDAREAEARVADGRSERSNASRKWILESQSVSSASKIEIQRLSRGRRHLHTEYRRAPRRAIGTVWTYASFKELPASVGKCGGQDDQRAGRGIAADVNVGLINAAQIFGGENFGGSSVRDCGAVRRAAARGRRRARRR